MITDWKKLIVVFILFAGALGLVIVEQVRAQNEEVVEELEMVVVTGRQIEEKLSAELADYGHQVQVIQGETIQSMGFVDTSDALKALVPGMYVGGKGRGDYNKFYMNGSDNVLWLMDGVRLNNRLYGAAYVDTLSVNMIDRIEVLFGGEGLFYGTEASSGVVNIITKKPTGERSGEVGVSYGSDEFVGVNGYASSSIGENNFIVFASHENWDGYQSFSDRTYDFVANGDGLQRGNKRGYDRTNIGLKYLREFGEEETDRTLTLHLQRNSGAFQFGTLDYRSALNDRTENVLTAKWDHDLTDNFSYYIKAYYHNWWTDYTRINTDGSYKNNEDVWGYQDWGMNVLGSYQFDRGDELLVGIDYQNYWGKDEVVKIDSQHEEVYAIFTQFRPHFEFWPEWKVAVGARYNYLQNNDSLVWNISSRMPFCDDQIYLRTNMGTSFVLPTAANLYTDESDVRGNPNLKPEESLAANIGLGANWGKGSLEIGGFAEEVTNLISTVEDASGISVYQNLPGEAKVYGYTLTATFLPVDSLALSASYTWQNAEDRKGSKIKNIPENFGNLNLQWNETLAGTPVGVGLFGRYTGDIPTGFTKYGENPPENYGDYWLADASIYANLTDNGQLSLYLANIFDKEYPTGMRRWEGTGVSANEILYSESSLGNPFSVTLSYTHSF